MERADRPAAILLGGDTPIGLAVVRELGERGVPVHVIARSRDGVGLYSRWSQTRHVRPTDGGATIELIERIAADHGAQFLMAVSEPDLLLLRQAADAGRLARLRLLMPKLDALQRVNDKMATLAAAQAEGVPVPATWQPADGAPPETLPDLPYPLVAKWRDPVQVGRDLERVGLAMHKAEYCYDADAVRRLLTRYGAIGRYPMLQEYCPGVGVGHMLFMHEGKALLRFQHVRRAEWPPDGGSSTVCESLPPSFHADWLAQSEGLLRRVGWQGAAMVEYRFDPATGRRWLMEINGRFWGSLPLCYHAGAHFAGLTYEVLGLGETPAPRPYRAHLTCRYMIPETRRVLTLLFDKGRLRDRAFAARPVRELFGYLAAFFRPSTRYYVFSWRDPMPFLVDMSFVVRKLFRAS